MTQAILTRAQFSEVFPAVILGARDLPRKPLPFHVLLISATLDLQPNRAYTEAEVNSHLQRWTLAFGGNLPIDYVELRRNLIDAGYLDRDAAGARYELRPGGGAFALDAPMDPSDLEALVANERARRSQRRQAYADRSDPST
jgi:hypothetical protein